MRELLDKIGGALSKGVGGLETVGSGIGSILAQMGGGYAPGDLDLSDRQKRGLLSANISDRIYGPGANATPQAPQFLNDIRVDNERTRRMKEEQALLGRIPDDGSLTSSMLRSQVAAGDVTGAYESMYSSGLEGSRKTSLIEAARIGGADEATLAMLQGFDSAGIEQYLEDERTNRTTRRDGDFNKSNTLRDEFVAASEGFGERADKFSQIRTAAIDPTAAGDIAMIFAFMKLLDPNSVVRESEYATAANAGPLVDAKTRGLYNQLIQGTRLLPAQRADFMKVAAGTYRDALKGYEGNRSRYKTLAINSDLNFDLDVYPDSAPGITIEDLDSIDYEGIKNRITTETPISPLVTSQNIVNGPNGQYAAIIQAASEEFGGLSDEALIAVSARMGYGNDSNGNPIKISNTDAEAILDMVNRAYYRIDTLIDQ